jgi:hypothetical protein
MFAGVSSTLFLECLGMTMRVIVPNAGMLALKDGEVIDITWSKESTMPVRSA